MAKDIDIFHPQATFEWKECLASVFLGKNRMKTTDQFVILHNKLFVALNDPHQVYQGKLGVFSFNQAHESYQIVNTPSFDFSLATYDSKLVIVGGKTGSHTISAKLWVSEDEGVNWKCSLPLMPTKRFLTTAVSCGDSPEHLVVAGGNRPCLVQVMKEKQWYTLPSLPKPCLGTSSTLHNGYLYLAGGYSPTQITLCCEVKSLLESVRKVERETYFEDEDTSVWWECEIPFQDFHLLSFGENLLFITWFSANQSTIYGYYPSTQSWVRLQDLPISQLNEPMVATILPGGQLLIYYNTPTSNVPKALQGSLTVRSCGLDDLTTHGALSKLERTGFPVLTVLSHYYNKTEVPESLVMAMPYKEEKMVIDRWIAGKDGTPNWRALLALLGDLEWDVLSQQVQHHLTDVRCLKDLCTSTILSTLLRHHPKLHADQIDSMLPPYVPPIIKHSLVELFTAHTSQLKPSPPPRRYRFTRWQKTSKPVL